MRYSVKGHEVDIQKRRGVSGMLFSPPDTTNHKPLLVYFQPVKFEIFSNRKHLPHLLNLKYSNSKWYDFSLQHLRL